MLVLVSPVYASFSISSSVPSTSLVSYISFYYPIQSLSVCNKCFRNGNSYNDGSELNAQQYISGKKKKSYMAQYRKCHFN